MGCVVSTLGLVVSEQSGGSQTIKLDRTPGRIADDSRQRWTCMSCSAALT